VRDLLRDERPDLRVRLSGEHAAHELLRGLPDSGPASAPPRPSSTATSKIAPLSVCSCADIHGTAATAAGWSTATNRRIRSVPNWSMKLHHTDTPIDQPSTSARSIARWSSSSWASRARRAIR
jgi:hypothetical protein